MLGNPTAAHIGTHSRNPHHDYFSHASIEDRDENRGEQSQHRSDQGDDPCDPAAEQAEPG